MARLVARRLTQAVVALVALSAIVFATSRSTGDPLALLLPLDASSEDHDRAANALGLDRPLIVQYGLFLLNILRGDLGNSLISQQPVGLTLWHRLGASLELSLVALAITVVAAIPLGVVSARWRGTFADKCIRIISLLGQSMPAFWVGIMLIQIFSVKLEWFPIGTPGGWNSVILPGLTIALYGIAGVALLLRSSMIEALDSEYATFARAKGMPDRLVVGRHALRNSLLPVVSFSGLFFVNILSFAVVVESVFAWPGIGSLVYTAVLQRDFPLIQGVTLLLGALAIFVTLAVDIIYSVLDPRIRHTS